MSLARGFGLALCVLGGLAAPSCYRAEIELKALTDASGGTAGVGGDAAAGEPPTAGTGGGTPVCNPDPLDAEQIECQRLGRPTRLECSIYGTSEFSGCYDGACKVCTKSVREFPYYFQWHPCCSRNPTCYSNGPVKCDARCPKPTERDKQPRCAATSVRGNLSVDPEP